MIKFVTKAVFYAARVDKFVRFPDEKYHHGRTRKMWRDRIIETMKEKGIKIKSVAEFAQLSEKTVHRMLTDPEHVPYVDNVIVVGAAVGLSPREIFSETGLVVGDQPLAALQVERDRLADDLAAAQAKVAELQAELTALTKERDLLQLKLDHKDELIKHKDKIIELLHKTPV